MSETAGKKELYEYQKKDLDHIFERFANCPSDYKLLYQLPTGGGKTVIFSEITRRYIADKGKKVLILTHRIELCMQTSAMLTEFGVPNMIIDSKVKEVEANDSHMCYVAMVETLNNRLQEKTVEFENLGLVIIDEAHYNSFRKLFKYLEKQFLLGVTATPLSSNIKLPMKDNYNELICGSSIKYLVSNGFLAKATTYTYDVGLGSLKVGINGDYTVKSSELVYGNVLMQSKLLYAYKERSLGQKTLIFNNGINTSKQVFLTFKEAGFDNIRHLDSKMSKSERNEIVEWFRNTENAVLTSVGILTTGFDEPTIKTIIMNRATKSPTLYYQMIGRGSRILPDKKEFKVVDLGNNAARFGLWTDDVDWQKIFKAPDLYLMNLISDEDIERKFKYHMPKELKEKFANSENLEFDIKAESKLAIAKGLKSSIVIDKSIDQHANIVIENSNDVVEAFSLARELEEEISYRVKQYCYLISKSTRNYRDWVLEDYQRRLKKAIMMRI